MTEAQNLAGQPGVDGATQSVELAGKEMIDSFDDDEMIFAGERGDERFDFFDGAVLVVASVHEQLGLLAVAQEREIRVVHGNAQADQVRDARVFAADAHTDPRTETESREQQRHTRKLGSKKIQHGTDIALLAVAAVVYAGAESRAAKIEAQHGDAESIERFRRLVNHFVVHRAAKKRMRMADNGGERRKRGSGRGPENRFEASGRAV